MVAPSIHRLPTHFAPAERLSPAEVTRQVAELGSRESLKRLLDTIPSLVVILNGERQILIANAAVERLSRTLNIATFEGLRLGEFFSCQHAVTAPHGCGTTEACRTCGAIHAILGAGAGHKTCKECRIATCGGGAHDLRATASPFEWMGRSYVLLVLEDISDEKRRHLLERIFFHDVLNTAGSVSGIATVIADTPELLPELKEDLLLSAETLVNEIKSHRVLLAAERGELAVQPTVTTAREVLQGVRQIYRNHPSASARQIDLDPRGDACVLETDPAILQRVLANMLKNALEASPPGGTVRIGADAGPTTCTFWCHNAGEIPRDIALQVFQRSFSTKGPGRGIGTYSIKLLGERYLNGEASFSTSATAGTRFQLRLARR